MKIGNIIYVHWISKQQLTQKISSTENLCYGILLHKTGKIVEIEDDQFFAEFDDVDVSVMFYFDNNDNAGLKYELYRKNNLKFILGKLFI